MQSPRLSLLFQLLSIDGFWADHKVQADRCPYNVAALMPS